VNYVESTTRVRYAETDQMGIAHHANYIVWFEIGRTDLCRATGIPYTEIERRGALLVVVDIGCRYRIPFRYDDPVVIRTSVGQAASRLMRFDYELRHGETGALHASGHSTHVWLDNQSRRPMTADRDVVAAFAPFLPATVSK